MIKRFASSMAVEMSVEMILEERYLFYSYSDTVHVFGRCFLVEKAALVLESNVKK